VGGTYLHQAVPRTGHLAGTGAATDLEHRFPEVSDSVQPALAEAATEGVHRQLAAQRAPTVGHEPPALQGLAPAQLLEPPVDERRVAVVELGDVDAVAGAAAVLEHGARGPRPVRPAGEVRWPVRSVGGATRGGQHER